MTTAIDPKTLGPHQIGQGIRLTWEDAATNGRTAVLQGTLDSVSHTLLGTSLNINVGFTYVDVGVHALRGASVEIV